MGTENGNGSGMGEQPHNTAMQAALEAARIKHEKKEEKRKNQPKDPPKAKKTPERKDNGSWHVPLDRLDSFKGQTLYDLLEGRAYKVFDTYPKREDTNIGRKKAHAEGRLIRRIVPANEATFNLRDEKSNTEKILRFNEFAGLEKDGLVFVVKGEGVPDDEKRAELLRSAYAKAEQRKDNETMRSIKEAFQQWKKDMGMTENASAKKSEGNVDDVVIDQARLDLAERIKSITCNEVFEDGDNTVHVTSVMVDKENGSISFVTIVVDKTEKTISREAFKERFPAVKISLENEEIRIEKEDNGEPVSHEPDTLEKQKEEAFGLYYADYYDMRTGQRFSVGEDVESPIDGEPNEPILIVEMGDRVARIPVSKFREQLEGGHIKYKYDVTEEEKRGFESKEGVVKSENESRADNESTEQTDDIPPIDHEDESEQWAHEYERRAEPYTAAELREMYLDRKRELGKLMQEGTTLSDEDRKRFLYYEINDLVRRHERQKKIEELENTLYELDKYAYDNAGELDLEARARVQRELDELKNGHAGSDTDGEIEESLPTEEQVFVQRIASAESFDALYAILREVEGKRGSKRQWSAEEVIERIERVREGNDNLESITRGSGVRVKVAELLQIQAERAQGIQDKVSRPNRFIKALEDVHNQIKILRGSLADPELENDPDQSIPVQEAIQALEIEKERIENEIERRDAIAQELREARHALREGGLRAELARVETSLGEGQRRKARDAYASYMEARLQGDNDTVENLRDELQSRFGEYFNTREAYEQQAMRIRGLSAIGATLERRGLEREKAKNYEGKKFFGMGRKVLQTWQQLGEGWKSKDTSEGDSKPQSFMGKLWNKVRSPRGIASATLLGVGTMFATTPVGLAALSGRRIIAGLSAGLGTWGMLSLAAKASFEHKTRVVRENPERLSNLSNGDLEELLARYEASAYMHGRQHVGGQEEAQTGRALASSGQEYNLVLREYRKRLGAQMELSTTRSQSAGGVREALVADTTRMNQIFTNFTNLDRQTTSQRARERRNELLRRTTAVSAGTIAMFGGSGLSKLIEYSEVPEPPVPASDNSIAVVPPEALNDVTAPTPDATEPSPLPTGVQESTTTPNAIETPPLPDGSVEITSQAPTIEADANLAQTGTVKNGGSLWKTMLNMESAADGILKQDLLKAWANPESMVKLPNGSEVHISQPHLVHAGDSLTFVPGEGGGPGKFVFEAKSGISAGAIDALKNPPEWLAKGAGSNPAQPFGT